MVEAIRTGIRYQNAEHMAQVIENVRPSYDHLLEILVRSGSEVRRYRVFETDVDVSPHRFVRRGMVEFVFPQQKTTLSRDNSGVIDPSTEYGLVREDKTYDYDPEKVRGQLRVEYNDANDECVFEITDVLGESKLPDEVKVALSSLRTALNPATFTDQ